MTCNTDHSSQFDDNLIVLCSMNRNHEQDHAHRLIENYEGGFWEDQDIPKLSVHNIDYYLGTYPDVKKLLGDSQFAALYHWLNYDLTLGRRSSEKFSIRAYLNRFEDLLKASGKNNYTDALTHWFINGKNEGYNPKPSG